MAVVTPDLAAGSVYGASIFSTNAVAGRPWAARGRAAHGHDATRTDPALGVPAPAEPARAGARARARARARVAPYRPPDQPGNQGVGVDVVRVEPQQLGDQADDIPDEVLPVLRRSRPGLHGQRR